MVDIAITDQTFEQTVLKSDKPVLVDFWAVWCGPCQMQGPIVEEVAKEMEGKAVVGKVNVDENPESAGKYGVMSIPTTIIFKGGQPVKQLVGVQSKEALMSALTAVVQ
jgi:thioredoxin 1